MKWKNPPESTAIAQRHTQWRQIADTLRANPGRWALIVEGTRNGKAGNIARAVGFQPRSDYEITDRKRPDGLHDTYARYVGEPTS